MLCATADDRSVIEVRPATDEDLYMTTQELADRWRCAAASLANQRSRGEGIPFVKLDSGAILYKVRDILDAETRGGRGFSWERLEMALRKKSGMIGSDVDKLLTHLKREMRG